MSDEGKEIIESEESKDLVDKTIIALEKSTLTTEYKAREILNQQGYSSNQVYYQDWDQGIKVNREIDIFARKLLKLKNPWNSDNEQPSLLINIIGDVKFREYDPKGVFIAFDTQPYIHPQVELNTLANNRKHLAKWLHNSNGNLPFIEFEKESSINLRQDFIFKQKSKKTKKNDGDKKKKNTRNIIKDGCSQVLSALSYHLDQYDKANSDLPRG